MSITNFVGNYQQTVKNYHIGTNKQLIYKGIKNGKWLA